MADGCVFCRIVEGTEPATIVRRWTDVIAIVPLNPVTDGHILVLPVDHVRDATVSPEVTARVMRRAAQWAYPPCNIITSAGTEATQTVPHLHVHVVPRREGDGLALPWTKPKVTAGGFGPRSAVTGRLCRTCAWPDPTHQPDCPRAVTDQPDPEPAGSGTHQTGEPDADLR